MNPANFRHRITFQKYDENAVNENGFPLDQWIDVKTVWSMIKTFAQGKEYYQAATTQNEYSTRFIIRYTTGINEDMRLIHKGQAYEITSIINDDERNKTLTLFAKRVL